MTPGPATQTLTRPRPVTRATVRPRAQVHHRARMLRLGVHQWMRLKPVKAEPHQAPGLHLGLHVPHGHCRHIGRSTRRRRTCSRTPSHFLGLTARRTLMSSTSRAVSTRSYVVEQYAPKRESRRRTVLSVLLTSCLSHGSIMAVSERLGDATTTRPATLNEHLTEAMHLSDGPAGRDMHPP